MVASKVKTPEINISHDDSGKKKAVAAMFALNDRLRGIEGKLPKGSEKSSDRYERYQGLAVLLSFIFKN